MQIISSCTVFCMLILTVFTDNEHQAISLSPANVTAVTGICALVSCTSTSPDSAKSIKFCECKSKTEKQQCQNAYFEKDRIKIFESVKNTKNCSFIIKIITADDDGDYELKAREAQQNTCNPKLKIIIQDEPVIVVPPLREREQANLSCSAPSPCPETLPNITWWITKRNGEITEVMNDTTLTTTEGFYNSTLTLTPTSELHNATVGCNVSYGDKKTITTNKTIEVMHEPTLKILGNNTVNEGDTLRLSCTVDSHPASSNPVWTLNVTTDKLMNLTSDGNLTITNVSSQHAGEYVCSVKYRDMPWNTSININVVRNTNETKKTDNVTIGFKDFLALMADKKTHIFLIGMGTSAIIFSVLLCCWVSCKRAKKTEVQNGPTDSEVNLKMVQTNIDLTVTNEQTPLHNQSDAEMSYTLVEPIGGEEESEAGGAEDGEASEAAAGDLDYAAIDYSLLKQKSPEEEESKSIDTDYAEIKRDEKGRKALDSKHDHSEDQKQDEEEGLYSDPDALKGQA
ncbi:sialic acid-binding Ig-like lectin 13 [Triplophysa dalaica]|uniref:sialic acid-binding Ig-like lectin 13 n=1 Tax=Triplophysa dalaica TaxID=1582913 RepID=UPI0024DFEB4A|nr:sialic acid-binding Ig-like lectin 13 [Triplophysa dalaica]